MEEEVLEEEIQVEEENYVVNADLSDYYTKEETDDLLDEKADITDIPDISGKQDLITSSNKLSSDLVDDNLGINKFVTSQEKTTWNNKQNALTFDSTPTLNSSNPVTSNGIAVALQNAGGSTEIPKFNIIGTVAENTPNLQKWYDDYQENDSMIFMILTGLNVTQHEYSVLQLTDYEVTNGTGYFRFEARVIPYYEGSSGFYGITGNPIYRYFLHVNVSNGTIGIYSMTTQEMGYVLAGLDDILSTYNTTYFEPADDYSPATKKYVDDNIPKATYLGKITEFTSVANAIDLNSLPKGIYSLNVDRTSRTAIYLKARYNNADITGSFEIYTGSDKIENDLVYITKTEDIPETEPYSSTPNCGYVSYTQGTNDIVYMYTKFIQLNSNGITFSTSYKQYNLCTKDTSQTITGKKTFSTLPESSVTPTTSNQLVNKQYVDDIVGNINTILATLTTVQGDN